MVRKKFSLVSLLKKAIKMFLNTLYITFVIAFSFGTLIAGILTILPAEASKASFLGYYSTCSFAPFSTIILFSLAFIGFILLMKLRKYFVTKSRKQLVYLENETLIKQN